MDGHGEDAARARKTTWKQDPDAVRQNILSIATEEFSAHGLSGASVNVIAARTSTSKRMIYYYFGDKEGLYCRVLERVYQTLRASEEALDVDALSPVEALRRLVTATFDAHANAPHFIRLVMIENIHNAKYLRRSDIVGKLNRSIIETLEEICARGRAAGVFRAGAEAMHLHWLISSFSFYNMSNRATFSAVFGPALQDPQQQAILRRRAADMVLAAVVVGYVPAAWDDIDEATAAARRAGR